ncbi:ParA family protein [Bacillus cereus group sp. Bce006]|uniref:ParA family protein n=1 Tax=Bacillus cereus group sp. Bce006 TaxID=3445255 RepID=UPI003F20C29A|nr:AAA family ATPase [Bacillus cereus]MCU5648391.1 AAA family ATPase [Bacillus cereus]
MSSETVTSKNGKVISFLNMKGGVGKTTLCKELAYYMANRGEDILVIDIDPQSNCTQSFFEKYGVETFDKDKKRIPGLPSIHNLYEPKLVDVKKEDIIKELSPHLHLLPGDLTTVFMERESNSKYEQRLLHLINDWKLKDKYHYIFIDCPPTYSFYTSSALMASDYYLVPARPDLYSILGLTLLLDVVETFITEDQSVIMAGRNLQCLGVVLTMVEDNEGAKATVKDIKEFTTQKGVYVFEQEFKYYPKLINSPLSTFTSDRADTNLLQIIDSLNEQFVERIEELERE